MKFAKPISLVIAGVVFISGLWLGTAQQSQVAPPFRLEDLNGKIVVFPEAFKDHAVFLHFWATWCPVCRRVIPSLQEFYQAYGDKVVILGINMLEDANLVRQFYRDFKLTYPVVLDKEGAVTRLYKIPSTDVSVWVDPRGFIRHSTQKDGLETDQLALQIATRLFESDLIPLGLDVKVLKAVDKNNDGKPDAELIDADADGRADGARIDADRDGKLETTALLFKRVARGLAAPKSVTLETVTQSNEKLLKSIRIDLRRDGKPQIVIIDADLDGKADQVIVDLDGDGKPDL
jgi:thiol-disulfide isomerase/thioredoxin